MPKRRDKVSTKVPSGDSLQKRCRVESECLCAHDDTEPTSSAEPSCGASTLESDSKNGTTSKCIDSSKAATAIGSNTLLNGYLSSTLLNGFHSSIGHKHSGTVCHSSTASTCSTSQEEVYSVKVNNVSPRISSRDLRSLFQQFGDIADIYIPRDYRCPPRSKGYCFVRFKSKQAAEEAATTLNKTVVRGRKIYTEFTETKPTVRQKPSINELPPFILTKIFSYLTLKDLARVGHLCQNWRNTTENIWRQKFKELKVDNRYVARKELMPLVEQHGKCLEKLILCDVRIGQFSLNKIARYCVNLSELQLYCVTIVLPPLKQATAGNVESYLNYLTETFGLLLKLRTLSVHKVSVAPIKAATGKQGALQTRGLQVEEAFFLTQVIPQRLALSCLPLSSAVFANVCENLSRTLVCLILNGSLRRMQYDHLISGLSKLSCLKELSLSVYHLEAPANEMVQMQSNFEKLTKSFVDFNRELELLWIARCCFVKKDLELLIRELPKLKCLFLFRNRPKFEANVIVAALNKRPLKDRDNPLLFFTEDIGIVKDDLKNLDVARSSYSVGSLQSKFRCISDDDTQKAKHVQKTTLKDYWSWNFINSEAKGYFAMDKSPRTPTFTQNDASSVDSWDGDLPFNMEELGALSDSDSELD